jgi:hypothetical protein
MAGQVRITVLSQADGHLVSISEVINVRPHLAAITVVLPDVGKLGTSTACRALQGNRDHAGNAQLAKANQSTLYFAYACR